MNGHAKETARFPDVRVPLSTYRGGSMLVAAKMVIQSLRSQSVPAAEVAEFRHAALGCISRREFLELCEKWVNVT
jgi:hypothetical protein